MTGQPLGAQVLGAVTRFSVFASSAERCSVRLFDASGRVALETHALESLGGGYLARALEGVRHGARYKFLLDDCELPDPYARFLPDGVHAPAMVVEPRYRFVHERPRRPLSEQVIYELHVGTFTREGTYAAAGERLPSLAALGVTALELLPLSAFPGARGWGYDGVAHFAPFAPYGEPDGLRAFIDRAHGLGLSVILDVVYNHFGPAGNYLAAYSDRYFTSEIQTPWGEAPRFSESPMRRYVLDNAAYWIDEFQFDGLRLDATHAIVDPSPRHVLRELADTLRIRFPEVLLFAEDERNEPALVTKLGCDAVWADDFHHQMRVTLTGESDGYFASYTPGTAGLARTIERGWLYEGQTFPSSGEPRGNPAEALAHECLVYCIQNHDQVGNRALGTRLSRDVELDAYCLASAILLFLPMTPLLFMGQEWAASTPFLFFTDHDAELGALVTAGRRREFARFEAFSQRGRAELIPDPQAVETFERSKLDWDERDRKPHAQVLELYRTLLSLRRNDPVLREAPGRAGLAAQSCGEVLAVRRLGSGSAGSRILLANFAAEPFELARAPWGDGVTGTLFATKPALAGLVPARSALVLTGKARGREV